MIDSTAKRKRKKSLNVDDNSRFFSGVYLHGRDRCVRDDRPMGVSIPVKQGQRASVSIYSKLSSPSFCSFFRLQEMNILTNKTGPSLYAL